MKLDRLISQHLQCGRKVAREHLRSGVVLVNGIAESNGARLMGKFDQVAIGDIQIQASTPHYVALNKPPGYVSATTDTEHPTVIDLIDESWADELHLAGRLDRYTTGLVILTNDSRFSEILTRPESKIAKVYQVQTDIPISTEAIHAIEAGMPFEKEGITTQPATVQYSSDSPTTCKLTIFEGKHHQVKRMFARFDIQVIGLHREAVGKIVLGSLVQGEYRALTIDELSTHGISESSDPQTLR